VSDPIVIRYENPMVSDSEGFSYVSLLVPIETSYRLHRILVTPMPKAFWYPEVLAPVIGVRAQVEIDQVLVHRIGFADLPEACDLRFFTPEDVQYCPFDVGSFDPFPIELEVRQPMTVVMHLAVNRGRLGA